MLIMCFILLEATVIMNNYGVEFEGVLESPKEKDGMMYNVYKMLIQL